MVTYCQDVCHHHVLPWPQPTGGEVTDMVDGMEGPGWGGGDDVTTIAKKAQLMAAEIVGAVSAPPPRKGGMGN